MYLIIDRGIRKEFATFSEAYKFREANDIQQPIYRMDGFGNIAPMSESQVQAQLQISAEQIQKVQQPPKSERPTEPPKKPEAAIEAKPAPPQKKEESKLTKYLRYILYIWFFLIILFFVVMIILPMLETVFNIMFSI